MALPRIPQVAAVATVITLGATVLAGCGGNDVPAAAPSASATPISELQSSQMTVVRVEFCDLVDRAAIRRALAGAATSASSWTNGDPVPGAGSGDIGHEVGCAWKGPKGRTARAWVFARPVSPSFARSLVAAAADATGCRVVAGPAFGKPTVAQICTLTGSGANGGTTRVRYAGLFTDTWLTCEVTGPLGERAQAKARAGTWCVSVATTLDAEQE